MKEKKIRIDWATSAHVSATFLSSKKGEVFSSSVGCKVYQPLKLRLL